MSGRDPIRNVANATSLCNISFQEQSRKQVASIQGDTYEITFQHSLKIQNEEIYITQEDFVNLLDAEIHPYADSDVSLYLTFEW
jgi:hypothetical protein